jgi:hypothetical protein
MQFYWDLSDWALGLSLIALTMAVHTIGVVMIALAEVKFRGRIKARDLRLKHTILTVIAVIGTVGLLLSLLHGLEYAIWAAAYFWIDAIDTPARAMLYSIDSMTTRGASGIMLQPRWQVMGALEAADGMILFGISTAYIFSMMQAWWSTLEKPRQ